MPSMWRLTTSSWMLFTNGWLKSSVLSKLYIKSQFNNRFNLFSPFPRCFFYGTCIYYWLLYLYVYHQLQTNRHQIVANHRQSLATGDDWLIDEGWQEIDTSPCRPRCRYLDSRSNLFSFFSPNFYKKFTISLAPSSQNLSDLHDHH